MARVNRNTAPYYDDYDSSKQYTQLLAIPGRVAQAREITQIQSTVKDIIKSIGDSVFKDGNIIEGCQIVVNQAKTAVNISAGKIYLEGMVLPVLKQTVAISGTGTEYIGVKLKETVVTESTDSSLRDPAVGYDNQGQPGCHRLKSETEIVVSNTSEGLDATIITTLIDGEIAVEKYAPEYDSLTQTLARRTYDESGSYIVEGLKVRVEADSDTNNFTVVIEPGKAYVLGYEIRIPSARRLHLPRALDYTNVTSMNQTYNSSKESYLLSNAPDVRNITEVAGNVAESISVNFSGNNNSQQNINLSIRVTAVKSGNTSYTFREQGSTTAADCEVIISGGSTSIKWLGTANYPRGSSYTVEYEKTVTFEAGRDYKLSIQEDVSGSTGSYLLWLNGTGSQKPVNGSSLAIKYEQYLARKDIIYINQAGTLDYVLGIPNTRNNDTKPEAPLNTLPLAYIMSPPGGVISNDEETQITVANVGLTRFTMNDIQKILNRIRTLEYDQTILSLNTEARNYSTTNDKRGIFTDPLIDFSKIDYYYNLSNGQKVNASLPKYDLTLDFESGVCYLPTESATYDAKVNTSSSTAKLYSRIATLKKKDGTAGESVVLSQMNATKAFLINPYSVYPQLPEISVDPAVDNWIEDKIIEVAVSQTTKQVVSTSTRNVSSRIHRNGNFAAYTTTSSSYQDTVVGREVTGVSTSDSVIAENAITYIRQRDVTVTGSYFFPYTKKIICYFDNVKVPLTPLGSSVSATSTASAAIGAVDADEHGKFTAKFKIPEKILTGIREVKVESLDTNQVDGYDYSAFTLYQASGTERTIQRTVTTITNILLNRVTTVTKTTYVDPVGQTFVLDAMTILSGIDLYFATKPDNNTPVTCEIRGVSNGTIDSTVYAHKTLETYQINLSSATRFNFEDPVVLEGNKEYAFVVRSTSPYYSLYVAELGGTDIFSGDIVKSNPYLIGVMMSSSNNSSWTQHQTTDVKFRLIADNYETSSEVYFDLNDSSSAKEFSRLCMYAEGAAPDGTSITWMYSVDGGQTYKATTPQSLIHLSVMINSQHNVKIKAVITRETTNANMTPLIALDSVGMELSSYDYTGGYYVSKLISGLDAYENVDIILDTYTSSGDEIKVYIMANSSELVEATLDSTTVESIGDNWQQATYKVRDLPDDQTQCRLFIKLSSSAEYRYSTPAFSKVRMIMS